MDPIQRRFEFFTDTELKSMRQGMIAYRTYFVSGYENPRSGISSSKMDELVEEINDELGERFNELQESPYVG